MSAAIASTISCARNPSGLIEAAVEFRTVPISIQYATVKRFTFAGHGYLMPSRTTKNGEVRGWE